MNLKKLYLKSWFEEGIIKDNVVFITEKDSKCFEKILNSNPFLKEKKQHFIDTLDSEENIAWLGKAEYIISSIELPTFFIKKKGQTYIQIINKPDWNPNFKRLLLHADYIVKKDALENISENFTTIIQGQVLLFENCRFFEEKEKTAVKKAKKVVVMYCGGFKNNGITSSALNLMRNLDKEKYQIVVIEKENLDYYEMLNFNKIPNHVIKVQIPGDINIAPNEEDAFVDFHAHPLEHLMKNGPTQFLPEEIKAIYKRELYRVLGDTPIDIAIDFDGYFKYWTLLLASSDSPQKIIYQHNEMIQEYSKKLGKKYKHRADLNIIFPLYNYFDIIVSVSKQTGEVNKQHLKHIIQDTSKMTYVHNLIDYEYILRAAKEESDITVSPDTFNFVTMGRLSPEKNHIGLIKAFYQLQKKQPDTQLFIIGLGELEEELKKYVFDIGLEDKVHILGQLENPFPIINACDAFVLSSIHEGQPMVLLECLVLQKKVVSTNIPGCYSLLKDGYGLLVDNSTEGLMEGMEKVMLGYDDFKKFDYKAYNKEAGQMLESKLEKE
ncbi:glycosyltransferase [Listeria farberi]|uniref:Glycosyltransferase n=1 Tax=Listeria farberi TaxID=2713500 RepID=A0A7X0ZI48_9LIST|nr:glycosyltransferase [Listeria farberi]MBC2287730.1 glycosyltransferase [Listeria farberi]